MYRSGVSLGSETARRADNTVLQKTPPAHLYALSPLPAMIVRVCCDAAKQVMVMGCTIVVVVVIANSKWPRRPSVCRSSVPLEQPRQPDGPAENTAIRKRRWVVDDDDDDGQFFVVNSTMNKNIAIASDCSMIIAHKPCLCFISENREVSNV